MAECRRAVARVLFEGAPLSRLVLQGRLDERALLEALTSAIGPLPRGVAATLHAEVGYEGYIRRQQAEVKRHAEAERRALPEWLDYAQFGALRTEARQALSRFRPATFGQASRLEGITPADLTLLAVLVERAKRGHALARGA
jgi:tRNA uridine 5-carboxymethylaminomethyl modification enzyme